MPSKMIIAFFIVISALVESRAVSLSWSPAGDALVWKNYNSGLIVVEYAHPRQSVELGEGSLPKWSPAGNKIAFLVRTHDDYNIRNRYRLVTVNPDGSGEATVFDSVLYHDSAWSPDGSRIAFAQVEEVEAPAHRENDYELYDVIGSARADGSDYREELRYLGGYGFDLTAWTSQGIVYCYFWGLMNDYRDKCGIFGENFHNFDLRYVGDYSEANGLMAFSSYDIREAEKYVRPANGIHVISVPGGEISQKSDLWPCRYPSWSPDGSWMSFVCDPGKLYVMKWDGSNPTLLDENPSYYLASWSPRGDKIAVRVFLGEDGDFNNMERSIY